MVKGRTVSSSRKRKRPQGELYGGIDPREIPAYTPAEAAHYLRIPFRTVHNWSFGYGSGRYAPLIRPSDRDRNLLSFVNVAELHVLDALRRHHSIPVRKLRKLIDYLEESFQSPHPLIDEQMFSDGVDVFVDGYGELINASKHGQLAMRAILEAHLRRIEQDVNGLAVRLFPFVRRKRETSVDALLQEPRLIALDPRIAFGRPVIAGTSIPTAEIADRFGAGDSLTELADDYGRPSQEIEEALRCELQVDRAA